MTGHPYYPQDIIVPEFIPGVWSVPQILGCFGVAVVLVLLSAWYGSGRVKHLSTTERGLACWWAVTGLIHIALEGPYALDPSLYRTPVERTNYYVEVWKEYAKGDSRYATRDSFIVSVEGCTAVLLGPLCLLAMYAILAKKRYRYSLQLVVSLCQLYGDVLYFLTCALDGFQHSVPGALYFWFYFVFMNSIWIVVPGWIVFRSWRALDQALGVVESRKKTK
eukprot:TRINITY_DN157_c0_g2_i1.p1 TRINITY_DN157_c0_g2~~TRINITY_DN157_c0_g2_i1.p1  ORF type:complete len:221 (-),score=11.27 TRINITY_DN157_c0_g2_i1:764-1426(-)